MMSDACVGYRWRWFGDSKCSSAGAPKTDNGHTVYVGSLHYGGTDQITVSTIHLARELNILSAHGPPFAQVLPVARDIGNTEATRKEALALFSEAHRPHVNISQIFDPDATKRCSSVRVLENLPAVAAEWRARGGRVSIPAHLVVASKHYNGPLISHTIPARALDLINQSDVTMDSRDGKPFNMLSFARKRVADYERRASEAYTRLGIRLETVRVTILPDANRKSPAALKCNPQAEGNHEWCGHAFLKHVAATAPNGTLLVFVSESTHHSDLPANDILRSFWLPPKKTKNSPPHARLRDDELAVTQCFKLSPRFDVAAERLLGSVPSLQGNVLAWQIRVEKLSLSFHKAGVVWFEKFAQSLVHQAQLVGAMARSCGAGVLLESDLLAGSSTMRDTIFLRHVSKELDPMAMYGFAAVNETSMKLLQMQLLDKVVQTLQTGVPATFMRRRTRAEKQGKTNKQGKVEKQGKPKALELKAQQGLKSLEPLVVLTAQGLLNTSKMASDSVLGPFADTSSPLLKLERALLAVAMLAKSTVLVRSPVSSTFSGWANAIRIAMDGRRAAGWTTEDGKKWWRCDRTTGVKLGKCNKQLAGAAIFDEPRATCLDHTSKKERGSAAAERSAAPRKVKAIKGAAKGGLREGKSGGIGREVEHG